MVDKTKKAPIPDQTPSKEPIEKRQAPDRDAPTFVRGTIDPPTKKGR